MTPHTRLPELQRALVVAAAELDRAAAVPVRHRRRRRMPVARILIIAVIVLLAAAAITAAATGLLDTGSDVKPRSGHPRPKVAFGVPAGAVAPPLRVPDPRGGLLDWGLRTFTTTRGFACLQIGRTQGDRLGVVGGYASFGGDGLFHPLPPLVFKRADCVALDGSGHGFIAEHVADFPVTGVSDSCLAPRAAASATPGHPPRAPGCDESDLRTVDFGLLGPHAKSITYRLPSGARQTVAVARDTGAFLIVSPHFPVTDEFLLSQTPAATTIVAVAYDDGTVCHVRHVHASAGGCPAKGFTALKVTQPSPAAVATPATAQIDRDGRRLHVAFRARLAASAAQAAYYLQLHPPLGCGADITGYPIERDVAAGERVGVVIPLGGKGCRGAYRVQLEYRVALRRSVAGLRLHYPGTIVDTLRVPIP